MSLYDVGPLCYRISPCLLSVLFYLSLTEQFAAWLKVTTLYSTRENESSYCSVSLMTCSAHGHTCTLLLTYVICKGTTKKDTRSPRIFNVFGRLSV